MNCVAMMNQLFVQALQDAERAHASARVREPMETAGKGGREKITGVCRGSTSSGRFSLLAEGRQTSPSPGSSLKPARVPPV